MAEFLSEAWIKEMGAAAEAAAPPRTLHLVVQQVVLGPRGMERAYAVRIEGGRVQVTPGRVDDATVTFTQDQATAEAIARGELSAQTAFLSGQLRVGGDLTTVLGHAGDLALLDDLFGAARASTTW